MAERKPRSDNSENSPDGFIVGVPVGGVIGGDGSVDIIAVGFIVARNEESARRISEALEEQVRDGHKEDSGKSTIGFSGNRWNSPWEPQGPKPNWKTQPPSDPALN